MADALTAALPEHSYGSVTVPQARRLHERVGTYLTQGRARVVEIGSYRGYSTLALSSALPPGGPHRVTTIDPFVDDGLGEVAEIYADFQGNLARAGVEDRVTHLRTTSIDAAAGYDAPIDLLFVDGDHTYPAVREDIAAWAPKVRRGGTMFLHDAYSSVWVTLAIWRELGLTREWRYVGRTGTLVEFRRQPVPVTAGLLQARELPWFARNLVVKAAIAANAWPVARALGHHDRWLPT